MTKEKVIQQLNIVINEFKELHWKKEKWDKKDNEDHYNGLVEVRKMIEQL